MLSDMV